MCAHKKISSISYSYSFHAKHNRDMNTFQTLKPNDKVIEHLAGTAKWIIHSRPQQLPACAPSSPWECSLPPTPTHYSNFPDLPPPSPVAPSPRPLLTVPSLLFHTLNSH